MIEENFYPMGNKSSRIMGSGVGTPDESQSLEGATMTPDTSYRSIPLTQGQYAIVDEADYESLNQSKWFAALSPTTRTFYAVRNFYKPDGKQGRIYMHREILGLEPGDARIGDHREPSQTLDNRRSNLRIGTKAQNNYNQRKRWDNTTGVKGVTFNKKDGLFRAQMNVNGKRKTLGSRKTLEAAAELYRINTETHYGEFARLE